MFYLAKHSETGQYLAGIDQDDEPIYSDDFQDALWSWSEGRLQTYIDDNEIETTDVQPTNGGNNPPSKPPF